LKKTPFFEEVSQLHKEFN